MGDYISLEAANEVCRECVRKYPSSFYNGIEAVRSELRNIPAADVRPRWIPVSERLPEEWWPVLGLIKFHEKEEPPAQQVLWYLGNGHWREVWRGDMIESDVTHWLPLPEPPEELIGTDMRGGIHRDDAGNVIDWGITGPPGDVGKTEEE